MLKIGQWEAGNISSEEVNSEVDVGGGTSSVKRDCFSCGREDSFTRDWRCHSRGRKCDQCGEIRHFKVKCRKKLAKDFHQVQIQGDSQRDWKNTSSVN